MSLKTQITLSKGGTHEHALPLSKIQIPDLWHIAELIRTSKEPWAGSGTADRVIQCWALTHDLHRHIADQPD